MEEHNNNLRTYRDAPEQSKRWVGDKIVKIRERKEAWFINHSIKLADLARVSSSHVLFDLLEIFKKASGLTINFTKTEGMCMGIGSSRNNKKKVFGIKWPRESINALGVLYTYDQKLLRENNFTENLDKITKLTDVWSSSGLSIYSTVVIIKTLFILKFVYVASLLNANPEWRGHWIESITI